MLKEKSVLNCFTESGPKSGYLSLHSSSQPRAPLREQLGVIWWDEGASALLASMVMLGGVISFPWGGEAKDL